MRIGWLPVTLLCVLPSMRDAAAAPTSGRPSVDQVLDELGRVLSYQDVALSPDGRRVAWSQSVPAPDGQDATRRAIYVAEPGDPKRPPVRVTAARDGAPREEHDLAWSPDGRQLAFLSDAEHAGQLELYVAEPGTSAAPRRLTDVTGHLERPSFSPDGRRIAVLHLAGASGPTGAIEAAPVETGVIDDQIVEQRVSVVPAAGGAALAPVSPADLFVYEYDWSPDGKSFVATGAHGAGDAMWWVAELYVIPAAGGAARALLDDGGHPARQMATPRFSPDGRRVAFIGGLMSDFRVTGGDVFVVDSAGGKPRDLTPEMHASAAWLAWTAPDRILLTEAVDGATAIASLEPSTGKLETLRADGDSLETAPGEVGLSVARDGETVAAVRETFVDPPAVVAGRVARGGPPLAVVGDGNKGIRARWQAGTSLHWHTDAGEVQGWLLAPPTVEKGARYPLVVGVHGGPASLSHPTFSPTWGPLASQGFYVLLPNPRGSYGAGEKFTVGNVKDFGGGDLRDILAGVEAAVKATPAIDPARVGIAGWSYGGFMTMWAVTQTDRFRAAVAGAGIANWQSYYGQNLIDTWMVPYFGASVYDDPAVYARASPITFIKRAHTPTLVLAGERDAEVPAAQSREFWKAERTLGVPTQLVIYAGEGHLPRQPAHRRDLARRRVEWLERWLAPTAPAPYKKGAR